jgi:small subunit ribosomal protein S19e
MVDYEEVNRPEKFTRASGAVIRKALQQLEAEGLISSSRQGRSISPKGRSFLDKLSATVKAKYPELKKY